MQNFFGSLTDLKAPAWAHIIKTNCSNCCNLLASSLLKISGCLTSKGTLCEESICEDKIAKERWQLKNHQLETLFLKCQDTYALGHSVTGKHNWSPTVSKVLSMDSLILLRFLPLPFADIALVPCHVTNLKRKLWHSKC